MTTANSSLYAIRPDGSKKWLYTMDSPASGCPAIGSDGTVYVVSDYMLCAISPSGVKKWDRYLMAWGNPTSPMVDSNGTIYVGTQDGAFEAYNPDGSMKWSLCLPDGVISSAIATSGVLYVWTDQGVLRAFGEDSTATPPAISIDGPAPRGPWDDATYTVTYERGAGIRLTDGDVKLNTTGSATGSVVVTRTGVDTCEVEVCDVSGNGTISISIAAGTARNAAGAAPAAGPSEAFEVANPPAVWVSGPSVGSTKKGPVSYTFHYQDAERITLGLQDIELLGEGTATGVVSVSGSGDKTRTVTISRITGQGKLWLWIGAETASNAVGYADEIGETGFVAVVAGPPTIRIDEPSDTWTKGESVEYQIEYTGADWVTLSPSDISLVKTGTANGSISIDDEGWDQYVTISDITGDGTIAIAIDAGTATNILGVAPAVGPSQTFEVFGSPSSGTISAPSAAATRTGPVSYIVAFSHGSSVNLAAADISLNKTGTADGSVTVDPMDNLTYRVTISNITGSGTLGISVAAGVAQNPIGSSPAIGPSATFAVISTPPGIQISAPSVPSTKNGPVSYAIAYTNAASVALTAGKVHLRKTGTATGSICVTGSGTSSRTVTISKIKGKGTLAISIDAGTATSPAGFALAAGPSASVTVTNR